MKCFAPAVQAFIFVDNLTLMAREALAVIQGYFAMLSFVALFSLTMDDENTYVWGLTAASRQTLLQLNFPCQFASELGASMTYGAKISNRLLKVRGTGMEDNWQKLRRSPALFPQKITVLPRVFWPRALHSSPACVFAEGYLAMLRRAATKALGVNGAGSNPMLRLCLTDNMQTDPGFVIAFRLCEDWQGKRLIFCIDEGCGTAIFRQVDTWPVYKSHHMIESDWMASSGAALGGGPWSTYLESSSSGWQITLCTFAWCLVSIYIWLRKSTIVPENMALTTA